MVYVGKRPGQYKKQSFVVIKSEEQGKNVLWLTQVLLLFRLCSIGAGETDLFAFVKYMEVPYAVPGLYGAL